MYNIPIHVCNAYYILQCFTVYCLFQYFVMYYILQYHTLYCPCSPSCTAPSSTRCWNADVMASGVGLSRKSKFITSWIPSVISFRTTLDKLHLHTERNAYISQNCSKLGERIKLCIQMTGNYALMPWSWGIVMIILIQILFTMIWKVVDLQVPRIPHPATLSIS